MNKTFAGVALAGTMMFSLAACGGKKDNNSSSANSSSQDASTAENGKVDKDGYIVKAKNTDSKSKDNDLVIAIEGSSKAYRNGVKSRSCRRNG